MVSVPLDHGMCICYLVDRLQNLCKFDFDNQVMKLSEVVFNSYRDLHNTYPNYPADFIISLLEFLCQFSMVGIVPFKTF